MISSRIIQNLVEQFARLPNIGPKSAQRLTFYLLNRPREELKNLEAAIEQARTKIQRCQTCFNFSESDPCPICANPVRNSETICLIAKPQDIAAIEKSGSFKGRYYLIGETPLEEKDFQNPRIAKLLKKIKTEKISEVILAFSPDIGGETSLLYLAKLLKQFPNLSITRPARGLPMGADLEYADEVTLENAFQRRQKI